MFEITQWQHQKCQAQTPNSSVLVIPPDSLVVVDEPNNLLTLVGKCAPLGSMLNAPRVTYAGKIRCMFFPHLFQVNWLIFHNIFVDNNKNPLRCFRHTQMTQIQNQILQVHSTYLYSRWNIVSVDIVATTFTLWFQHITVRSDEWPKKTKILLEKWRNMDITRQRKQQNHLLGWIHQNHSQCFITLFSIGIHRI